MALIERGKAEGQIAGDDVRRAFEADQIPANPVEERTAQPQPDPRGGGCDADGQCRGGAQAHPKERRSEEPGQAHRHQDGRGEDGDHARRPPPTAAPAAPATPAVDDLRRGEAAPAKKAAAKKTRRQEDGREEDRPPRRRRPRRPPPRRTTASSVEDEAARGRRRQGRRGRARGRPRARASSSPTTTRTTRPAQQVATAGATADPVKDYLKQIGKVALLNAEQEVELAKRIEAGLFAEEQAATPATRSRRSSSASWSGSPRTASGPRTTCSRPTSASSSRWPSATPAAACSSWT